MVSVMDHDDNDISNLVLSKMKEQCKQVICVYEQDNHIILPFYMSLII